jgi:hypothetical protein
MVSFALFKKCRTLIIANQSNFGLTKFDMKVLELKKELFISPGGQGSMFIPLIPWPEPDIQYSYSLPDALCSGRPTTIRDCPDESYFQRV